MVGTENVNLTVTTGKYEIRLRVLYHALLFFLSSMCVYVYACVCQSDITTDSVLMSPARSHRRHYILQIQVLPNQQPLVLSNEANIEVPKPAVPQMAT